MRKESAGARKPDKRGREAEGEREGGEGGCRKGAGKAPQQVVGFGEGGRTEQPDSTEHENAHAHSEKQQPSPPALTPTSYSPRSGRVLHREACCGWKERLYRLKVV